MARRPAPAAPKPAAPKPPKPAAPAVPDAEAAPYLHRPVTSEASPWLDSNPEAAEATAAATAAAED
jgi:hypothetical protein